MDDHQSPAKLGLSDEELADHPTVFASDALKGQVVIVSGAAGGIGRAIAFLFARLGAHVVAVGRNQDKLDVLISNLAGRGLSATAHVVDIKEPDEVAPPADAAPAPAEEKAEKKPAAKKPAKKAKADAEADA